MNIGLRKKLLGSFLLVLLIPSIIISLVSYTMTKNKMEANILSGTQQNVTLVMDNINREIQPEMQDVTFFSNLFSKATTKKQVMLELGQFEKTHGNIMNTYLGTSVGQMYLQPIQSLPAGYDPRKRPWYIDAMQHTGQVIITAPYVDASTGDLVITIAKTLSDNSGVMAVDLNLNQMAIDMKKLQVRNFGFIVIYGSDRHVLVDMTSKPGNNIAAFAVPMYSHQSGQYLTTVNHQSAYITYSTNQLTGWKVGAVLYASQIYSTVNSILQTTLIVLVLSLLVFGLLFFLLYLSIMKPLQQLSEAVVKVSEGKLTEHVEIKSRDIIGQLANSFNNMTASLRTLIQNVSETSSHLASASEELTSSAEENSHATEHIAITVQEVAVGSEKQSHNVENSTRAVNAISTQIQQIAERANLVSTTSIDASNMADSGKTSIKLVHDGMNVIKDSVNSLEQAVDVLGNRSKQIGEIVSVITNISQQTNLLALNAAIEAARAGEHGRGFAVVADEVRKLAAESAESADQITALVNTIQTDTANAIALTNQASSVVDDGSTAVELASEAFSSIENAIANVTHQIHEVSNAVKAMASDSDGVVNAMQLIHEIATSNSLATQNISKEAEEQLASMEEIAASANSLEKLAGKLQTMVERFIL